MRIRCLQHVPFEDPGFIHFWFREYGHSLSKTALYASDIPRKIFPKSFMACHWYGDTFDLLSGAIHPAKSKGMAILVYARLVF